VAAMDLLHIAQEPFELVAVAVDVYYYSCPSERMALAVAVVALGMAAVLLDGSNSLHTCCCSCGPVALEIVASVGIDSWARGHMGLQLPHVLEPYVPELEQLVHAVCSKPQPAAAAEFQVQVIGLQSLTSGSLGVQMGQCTSPE